MKRVLSLVLALSMVFSMFTFSFAGLKDVEGTDYESAVEALIELGVVAGYPDGTYLPEKTVSRAEMAKLLVIAAGLEPAAEVAVGTTRFSDVDANHWACGYINVASEYGYIAGYPEGTFMPDAEVKYSEAVTMALRVLGYRTVVEAKGTWPTNYIAKAQDLEMLEGVTYGTYSAGATRGNVAMIVWNMLKTAMWDVEAESEGDGLQYGPSAAMLNVKFPDYSYSKALFVDFSIDDGEVMIGLDDQYDNYVGSLKAGAYEYAGNDFYTFVPGTEVEVLVNEEDETLLTIVPTGKDKLVEGSKEVIDDDYDNLVNETYDYAYAMIERRDVSSATLLVVSSEYVDEVKSTSTSVKINSTTYKDKTYEDAIVLIDGERASLRDVEEGNVLSTVEVDGEKFFVVASTEVEGKLTKYVKSENKVTVAGEEYLLAEEVTYLEDPADEDETPADFKNPAHDFEDMKNEEVKAVLDFIGEVVRFEFDGSIADDDSEVMFFAAASNVNRDDDKRYVIELADAEGETAEYMFSKSINSKARALYNFDGNIEGTFVVVRLDDEGEIVDFETIASSTLITDASGDRFSGEYLIKNIAGAVFDSDKNEIVSGEISGDRVKSATVVVSVVVDDQDTESAEDDEYEITFETGISAAKNIKGEDVVVITEAGTTSISYVVRLDNSKASDEKYAAKVEEEPENLLNKAGKYEVVVDDTEYLFIADENEAISDITDYAYGVLAYTLEDAKEDGEEVTKLNVLAGYTVDELKAFSGEDGVKVVGSAKDGEVIYSGETKAAFEFGDADELPEAYVEKYENALFVAIDVNPNLDDEDAVESVEVSTFEDLTLSFFAKGAYVLEVLDGDEAVVVFVVDVDDVEGEEGSDEGSSEGTTATKEYTITWSILGVETTTKVAEGLKPTAPETAREGYTFVEWSPEIEYATKDARYVATYDVAQSSSGAGGN